METDEKSRRASGGRGVFEVARLARDPGWGSEGFQRVWNTPNCNGEVSIEGRVLFLTLAKRPRIRGRRECIIDDLLSWYEEG